MVPNLASNTAKALLALACMTMLALTSVAHAESPGRRPAHMLSKSKAAPLGAAHAAAAPAAAPVCPVKPANEANWIAWRDAEIKRLLRLRKPSASDVAHGQHRRYLNLEDVLTASTRIADTLDACEQAGAAPPANVLGNLREFTRMQRNANYLLEPAFHQFGHGVNDQTYLERALPLVKLPCLLKSQDFLKALNQPATYRKAYEMILAQNQGATVNGCAAEKPGWQTLIYRSRFLGTPDDAETLGRFFVLVPAADDSGHDRWIQFGIWLPEDHRRSGPPIQNVSVVAVARGKTEAAPDRFDALVDWYRCRNDSCSAKGKDDTITLQLRYAVTNMTGNCQECHKLMPLSIHPERVYDIDLGRLPDAAAAAAVDKLNSRFFTHYKRQPLYETGPDDALASPSRYGPPFATNPDDYKPLKGTSRTTAAIAACKTAQALPAASQQAVVDAMNCGDCHANRPASYGALNFPQATEKRRSMPLKYREKPPLDLAPNLIETYILKGIMPPAHSLDRPLTGPERQALYDCLSKEYFDPAKPSGLFVDWLRQEAVPSTLVAATRPVAPAEPDKALIGGAAPLLHAAAAAPPTRADFDACARCHVQPQGTQHGGPSLVGVYGRRAAATPYDDHSPALRKLGKDGLVWNDDTLMAFLKDPDDFLRARVGPRAESTMVKAYPDEALRRRIIEYLKTLK